MCLSSPPTDAPSRMPSPSSYVEPRVNSLEPRAGVCAATMSGFITKPPAASTTAAARTTPVWSNDFQATPTTSPDAGGDEVGHAGLVADLDARLLDLVAEQVHHHLGAVDVAGHGHLVAARRRAGLVEVGPDLLVAGEHQPLGAGLDHRLLRVVGALELEAQRLQPAEVLDRALAVGADLVGLGLLRGRGEVLDHLLDRVLVAGRGLHRGAAAEVEVAARQRRRAAVHGRLLEQQHPRARAGGLERGTPAGDAEAHHDHVVRRGVRGDVGVGADVGEIGASHGVRLEQVLVPWNPARGLRGNRRPVIWLAVRQADPPMSMNKVIHCAVPARPAPVPGRAGRVHRRRPGAGDGAAHGVGQLRPAADRAPRGRARDRVARPEGDRRT